MVRFCFFLVLLTVAWGCTPHYEDYFPYHEDGSQKPHVAFIPTIDSSKFSKTVDLGQEFTAGIRTEMMYHGELFLFPEDQTVKMIANAGKPDYFGDNLSFTNKFKPAEYIVVTDLVEHQIASRKDVKSSMMSHCVPGQNLVMMKVHVRVIDLIGTTPKVTLDETIKMNYAITNAAANNPEDPKGYSDAHGRLIEQIADRLENTLLSDK